MINWLCGAPPARPPPPSSVKTAVTHHNASVVSITGIAPPICRVEEHVGELCPSSNVCTAFGNARIASNKVPACKAEPAPTTLRGIGVLIHPTLVLTTHSTIPFPSCIRDAEITFCRDVSSLTYVKRKLVPEIFFETNAELDVTIVACEIVAPNLSYSLPLDTTKLHRRSLRKDHSIFIMGCQARKPDDIVIMDGCISGTLRSQNLQNNAFLRFQTAGDDMWMPGTAGFDEFGSFSFIVTQPLDRLQEDVQSPSCQQSDGQPSICSSVPPLDRGPASPQIGRLFAYKPKQLATCVQAIKEWVEPLWREKRNEVFDGTVQSLMESKQTRRRSTQGDALFRQKSFTPRSSICAEPQAGHTLTASKAAKESGFAVQQPAVVKADMERDELPSCGTKSKETLDVMHRHETDSRFSDEETDAISHLSNTTPPSSYKRHIVLSALSKQNNELPETASKPLKPTMESVLVQTTTPPDDQDESQEEEEEDALRVLQVRRASEPSEGSWRSEGKKVNAGRERSWSLPGEPDPVEMKGKAKLPVIQRGAMAATSNTKGSAAQPSKPGASSWIDSYYSLGRSRSQSNHSVKALRPGAVADSVYEHDSQLSDERSPNMQCSLSAASCSLYSKPTLSYMQRRSLAQQEQLARRASQPSNSPRWS